MRFWAACLVLVALCYGAPAAAITIPAMTYDAANDQLVMTIAYRGTHPRHVFSVQWDKCDQLDQQRFQILGLLVDSEPNDLARQEFTQQLKVDLKNFTCRPAKVTIKTSAGFFASVDIPATPKKSPPGTTSTGPRNAAAQLERDSATNESG